MCILENLRFRAHKEHVIHSFPPNQSHIRITSESRHSKGSLVILEVTSKSNLYNLLGQPEILEIQGYATWNFEIPRALRQGIFKRFYIGRPLVEPGTETPKLVYLDLSQNALRAIGNISELVNLEVLLLADNRITTISPDEMINLTKLRILDLSYNYLSKISLDVFPKSLTHLNLFSCRIKSLNYNHLYYPSLNVLNLEQNKLTQIDAPALLLAMPSLKVLRIGWNLFDPDGLQQALRTLTKHNVSYRTEADQAACDFDEQILEGVCIAEPDPPRSVLKDVLLSFGLVAVVLVLGITLTWVFVAMRGKS